MEIIELLSDPSLKYEVTKVEDSLDLSFLESNGKVTFLTSCSFPNLSNKQRLYINGTSRLTFELCNDVVLYNIRTTSPFYASIFWDVAHKLKVGNKIYVYEESDISCIYERDYFEKAFEILEKSQGYSVFKKTEMLICEKEKGLGEWTFGIPVGPEEPVFLNYTVERILNLGLDNPEIILCGKPHHEFKYFDRVKIVGEDIPAPPVHITKKKNTIVEHATKKNLCMIHDRVLLPLNFKDAMSKFGDLFPMVGMQSFYFTDYNNLIPRKYSDFNTLSNSLEKHVNLDDFNKESVELVAHNYDYFYQHPMRASFGQDYLTGSLYICKTKLWQKYPQNEALYWDDFEDVEYGSRISLKGIPSIINPHTITQSMNARSLIHYYGYINAITKEGKVKLTRSLTEVLFFGRKKPLFRITEKEAIQRMLIFAKKYTNEESVLRCINSCKFSGRGRLKVLIKIVNNLELPLWKIDEFIVDFNKNILFEAMPPKHQKDMKDYLSSNASPQEKKSFIINSPFIFNQLSNGLNCTLFSKNNKSWHSKKSVFFQLGCWISAFNLKYFYNCTYLPMSLKDLKETIMNTSMISEG